MQGDVVKRISRIVLISVDDLRYDAVGFQQDKRYLAPWGLEDVPDTPHLDGVHTVFGHVTQGMDAVDQLNPTDSGRPADKIIKATVKRKRDHAYEAEKLKR